MSKLKNTHLLPKDISANQVYECTVSASCIEIWKVICTEIVANQWMVLMVCIDDGITAHPIKWNTSQFMPEGSTYFTMQEFREKFDDTSMFNTIQSNIFVELDNMLKRDIDG